MWCCFIDGLQQKIYKEKVSFSISICLHCSICSTIQSAEQILLQPKFHGQHTVIFHFGVNDIDNLTTEDIVDKMINITELCKGKYPDVKLYISGITPRSDSLNEKVKEVNRLLKDNIHRKKLFNVFFIDNDNLDNEELLYDNKHLKRQRSAYTSKQFKTISIKEYS